MKAYSLRQGARAPASSLMSLEEAVRTHESVCVSAELWRQLNYDQNSVESDLALRLVFRSVCPSKLRMRVQCLPPATFCVRPDVADVGGEPRPLSRRPPFTFLLFSCFRWVEQGGQLFGDVATTASRVSSENRPGVSR